MSTKPVYRKMQIDDLNPEKENEVWSAKIDGAHTVVKMKAGKTPELFSHRVSKKTDKPIPYTSKLPHIGRKSLYDAEVRGETYAITPEGRAVHPDIVTALLNSGLQKSLAMQKQLGITTATALIDLDSFNGQDMRKAPYQQKRDILNLIAKTNPDFHLPDTAYDAESKKKMLDAITGKTHHQTNEGIVVHDLSKPNTPFTKAKVIDHHDVYITGIFNEEGVKEGRKTMAGGFTYAWTPDGKTVGKVGTGFDHDMKTDMYHHPDKYIGRVAKVKALDVSKNKVLVKPSFDGWHVEKNLAGIEKKAGRKRVLINLLQNAHGVASLKQKKEKKIEKEAATIKGKKRACGLGKDDKGYYVKTHRARSKSYASPDAIPEKDIKFIESTGSNICNMMEKLAKALRPKTYAVDFDGTIVTNAYPRIGKPKKETIDFIKKVHGRGDRVIIWTSRGGKPLDYMQKFLDKNQIPYHEINSNSKFKTGSPKIIADHYIDDKAVHVDDLHKIAKIGAFMEKIAALPGAVHRTMSGLINKKLTTVAPIVPKTATFTRPSSMTGGGTKKIAEGGTFMDLLEKLAAGFKTKRTKDYDAQTRGKRPQPEKQFRKPTPTPTPSAPKVETAAKSGVGSLLNNVKKGMGGIKDAVKGVGAKLGTKGKIGLGAAGLAAGGAVAYGASREKTAGVMDDYFKKYDIHEMNKKYNVHEMNKKYMMPVGNKAKMGLKGKLGLGAAGLAAGGALAYGLHKRNKEASDYIEEQFEKLAGTAWKKYLLKSEGTGKSIADRVKEIKPTVMKDMGIQKIPGVEYNVDEIAKGKVRGDIAKNKNKILNAMG